jgi:hypothetical protein
MSALAVICGYAGLCSARGGRGQTRVSLRHLRDYASLRAVLRWAKPCENCPGSAECQKCLIHVRRTPRVVSMMRAATRILSVAIVTVAVLLLPRVVEGCSCVAFEKTEEELTADLRAEFERATAVFVGRTLSGDLHDATFEVSEIWKGDIGERVTVYTSAPPRGTDVLTLSSCDFVFTPSRRYLVFAYGPATRMQAYQCSPTSEFRAAAKTITRLNTVAEPKSAKPPNMRVKPAALNISVLVAEHLRRGLRAAR